MGNKEKLRPGITVVIPVFNRAGIVEETLESLRRQTRRPDEVILVDNGSSDNSMEILSAWASKMNADGWNVTVISEPRGRAAHARQTGLDNVRTEYVMFFDSDDWMQAGHIESIMDDFNSDQRLDIVCWSVRFHYSDGSESLRRVLPDDALRNHLVQGLLSTLGYAVRTEYIRRIGGWNISLGGWDDLELGVRLLLGNPKIKIDKKARADVRVHEDSMSKSGYGHRVGDWEKTLDEIECIAHASSHPRRQDVLRLLAYRRINLAAHYHREGLKRESLNLRKRALEETSLRFFDRLWLRLAYLHTASGLPAAGGLYPHLLV